MQMKLSLFMLTLSSFLMTFDRADASVVRWPLDQIVARALANSPEMKALDKDVDRAEAVARRAGQWENPEASVGYGPMSQGGLSGTNLDLSVRQAVPLFGQKAASEQTFTQDKKTIEIENEYQILNLRYEVTLLAYRLAAILEEENHIAHRRENIRAIARFLASRPHASPAQAVEKSLIQNRLREIEEDLIEITTIKTRLWEDLNVFLASDNVIEPIVQWDELSMIADREVFWSKIEAHNPLLRAKQSAVLSAELSEKQAQKKQWPDIRLGFDYNRQTAEFPQRIYAGVIEFSLPVIDRGASAKAEATARKEAGSYRVEQTRRELKAKFGQGWMNLLQCRKKIDLYPRGLLQSSEREFQLGEDGWKKGLVSTPAFLELEHQMHSQAVRYYAVRVDYVAALNELLKMAGQVKGGTSP